MHIKKFYILKLFLLLNVFRNKHRKDKVWKEQRETWEPADVLVFHVCEPPAEFRLKLSLSLSLSYLQFGLSRNSRKKKIRFLGNKNQKSAAVKPLSQLNIKIHPVRETIFLCSAGGESNPSLCNRPWNVFILSIWVKTWSSLFFSICWKRSCRLENAETRPDPTRPTWSWRTVACLQAGGSWPYWLCVSH